MRPIPSKLRQEISQDNFMKKCCLCYNQFPEWHHAIIFQGKQLNEKWAIVPACKWCHKNRLEELEYVALERATDEELQRISKGVNYKQRRDYLDEKYA